MADATGVNVAVFGKEQVGKTALLARYLQNEFTSSYEPTMMETYTKESRLESTSYALTIGDTGADPALKDEREKNRAKANVFILVYSITDKDSLEYLKNVYADVQKAKPGSCIVVVGNKTDSEDARQVSTEEGQAAADSMNASCFFEASAKNGTNVETIFKEAVLAFATGKRQQKVVAEPPPPPPTAAAPAAAQPAALQKVEGWLTKTPRGLFGSQQHRFFKLEGKALSYFKSPEDKEPIRVLNLCNASFIVTANTNTFKLDGPSLDPVKPGAVTLTTNNKDEFEKWRVAIDLAIRA